MSLIVGERQELIIVRDVEHGLILSNDLGDEVLLPITKSMTEKFQVQERIDAFVYFDNKGRLIATLDNPKACINEFAYLEVIDVNEFGAFVDWGIPKDLFIPYAQQKYRLVKGQKEFFFIFLDEVSNRILGSNKIKSFISQDYPVYFSKGVALQGQVYLKDSLGCFVILENKYEGLLHLNEYVDKLNVGDRLEVYIKNIRDDKKIDLSLKKEGYLASLDDCPLILEILKNNNNFLAINAKSSPDDIYNYFKMSKKQFKKAIGHLYKTKQINILEDGIALI